VQIQVNCKFKQISGEFQAKVKWISSKIKQISGKIAISGELQIQANLR
jgi:hypothetical protein